MFIKVLQYDIDEPYTIALSGFSGLEEHRTKKGQTCIFGNRYRSETDNVVSGMFRSPHSLQRVQQTISVFAGFLAGERQSFLELPMTNNPSSPAQQVSGWTLDLSDAKGIQFIETTAIVDSNGNLQFDDGSSITVKRASPSGPALLVQPKLL